MISLEGVMDIQGLKRQGFSLRGIARKLGIHRQTAKKYFGSAEKALDSHHGKSRGSKIDPYTGNIETWLKEDSGYTAQWIFERLQGLGFGGSYEIVKRKVHDLKSAEQHLAYMRFETEPAEQAQVDFGEFVINEPNGKTRKVYIFCMILGYSRKLYAEIIERCDLPTFLDCHIRAFEYFKGVPREILYDRMKNVYIGKIAGKAKFNDSLVGFALHYGFTPKVAPAYAAWVKGKVERPYQYIRENFWRGYAWTTLACAQKDLLKWLTQKEERVHGTTHEVVRVRYEREATHLGKLPNHAWDTSYRIYREVRKDCTVLFEGNRYVVPHRFVRYKVVLRVKNRQLRVFCENELAATYDIPAERGQLVAHPEFYEALKKDREMNRRKYGSLGSKKGRAKYTISPDTPTYELDVELRALSTYEEIAA